MPANARAVDPGEVLLEWAESERDKTARAKGAIGKAQRLSSVAEEADLAGLVAHRHSIVAFFLLNRTDWYAAEVTLDELAAARTMSQDRATRSRTVGDLAKTAAYGIPGFDPGAMRARPILVAETLDGGLCLLDGYHRACELLRGGHLSRLDVFVGVCPALARWRWLR